MFLFRPSMITSGFFLFFLLALGVLTSSFSFAQSVTPQAGGACSQAGAFAGNYNSGAGPNGNLLVCYGAHWVRFMGYNTDGTVQFLRELQIGKSTGMECGPFVRGALRYSDDYNDGFGALEFCNGSSWIKIEAPE